MKSKKIVVFLLVAAILLLFNVRCFAASDYKEEKEGYIFYMPSNVIESLDSVKNKFTGVNTNDYYYSITASFYFKNLIVTFYPKDDVNFISGSIQHNDSIWAYTDTKAQTTVCYTLKLKDLDLENHSFNIDLDSEIVKSEGVGVDNQHAVLATYNSADNYIYYVGNIPLYHEDNSSLWVEANNDFFFLAPAGTLAEKLEKVDMSQVLQEITQILPLILVVLVSLVGLRKALKMLVNFSKQS